MTTAKPISSVETILDLWQQDPDIAANIIYSHTNPSRSASYASAPAWLYPALRRALHTKGIESLYSHQTEALEVARRGENIVIVTGTASGKTLCYNLPVLDEILRDHQARALYLFPTKALAQDQHQSLQDWTRLLSSEQDIGVGVYDGDTPDRNRNLIRVRSNIVISNPDMLHTGILPHHTIWAEFFRNLRFVILDETHTYRGIFGSHVANLVRRLKRIARFYGSNPQFILTTATIANPQDFAQRLIELPVTIIDQDGSPRGPRHFLIYNPPLLDANLGLRASPLTEGSRLIEDLLSYSVQTIAFCKTRRSVELMLRSLQLKHPDLASAIDGYRSGYLPNERRRIEQSLRQGQTTAVIATNALELGIDVGTLSASILIGYPGTIASARQQMGRAGRKRDSSLAVLVASPSPLDQYLVQHPEYLLDQSPEQALIDANHLLILLQHIRCASFELPFKPNEPFGSLDSSVLQELLRLLAESGELHSANDQFFWMAETYPSTNVSLRSSSADSIVLRSGADGHGQVIGQVDIESAYWMVHPGAIYLHSGQTYLVENLDIPNKIAYLKVVDVDYYTDPQVVSRVEKEGEPHSDPASRWTKFFGNISVTSQVVGYRKKRWLTHENLGFADLTMPSTTLHTCGYWLGISDETVDSLRDLGLWTNDPNDYGPRWNRIRDLVRSRDKFTCQVCGSQENGAALHVHHIKPFRMFTSVDEANHLENLITLCPTCHRRAETRLRIRSGLAGLGYILHHLAPLFLMCDINDLGTFTEPDSKLAEGQPAVVIFDLIPAGIGLSEKIFQMDRQLIAEAGELIKSCKCEEGCPSCVGPAGENGIGGKKVTLALIDSLLHSDVS